MADNYTALKSSQKKRYISKETFNSLDLSQIPVGSEYEVVSPIEKGDLSADINNALNKAENALPKPTNDTTGSAGQVLKKTANGSEWGDAPSGGGKLYRHNIHMTGGNGEIYFTLYASQKTAYTSVSPIFSILGNAPYQFVYYNGADGIGIGVVIAILDNNSFNIRLYKVSSTSVTTADILLQTPTTISDTVIEL